MERETEIGLIEELLGLREAKSHYLDDGEFNSVDQYQSRRFFSASEITCLRVCPPSRHMSVNFLTQAILLSGISPGDQSW